MKYEEDESSSQKTKSDDIITDTENSGFFNEGNNENKV